MYYSLHRSHEPGRTRFYPFHDLESDNIEIRLVSIDNFGHVGLSISGLSSRRSALSQLTPNIWLV